MGVYIVLDHLRGLLPGNGRRALVIHNIKLEWTAIDAAVFVDAVGRHLQSDDCGLAAGGAGAGQRLLRTDFVRLGRAERGAPRRRHQHHGADRAAAPADNASTRDFAAVPDVLGPFLFFPLLSHGKNSPLELRCLKKARVNKRDLAGSFN